MSRQSRPRVTHLLAVRHEALWLKLSMVHAQLTPVANRRPQTPVSAHTGHVAEALLRDALPFLDQPDPLPAAAPDHGGLLTQLGQALAQLEAWELANISWRADLNAFVWDIAGDAPLPLRRLRPKTLTPRAANRQDSPARNALYRRIMALKDAARS